MTYVLAVTAMLAEYPIDTIQHVTDPRTGLPAASTWMPSVAEVRIACEEHDGTRRRAEALRIAGEKQINERLAVADYRPKGVSVKQWTYEEFTSDPNFRGQKPIGRFEVGLGTRR